MSDNKKYPPLQISETRLMIKRVEDFLFDSNYSKFKISQPDSISLLVEDVDGQSNFFFSFTSHVFKDRVMFRVKMSPSRETSLNTYEGNQNDTGVLQFLKRWVSLIKVYNVASEKPEDETIKSENLSVTFESEISEPNYWLLKMNPNTWIINNLNKGVKTFFNTYYFGTHRPEFNLFSRIKKGDFVLGYVLGINQGIVCNMRIIEPVGENTRQGEGFVMEVTNKFNPVVSRNQLEGLISEIMSKTTVGLNRQNCFLNF